MNPRIRISVAGALALACGVAFAQAPEGKLYTPGAFERVEIDGAGQVRVVQGERDEVFVNGDARQQAGVEVEVSGKTLHLDLPGGWKFWDSGKAQVEVRVRHLAKLTMQGAGDVYASGAFSGPSLGIEVAGSGVVHFDDLHVDISGAGHVRYLGSPKVRQSISGLGSVDASGDRR